MNFRTTTKYIFLGMALIISLFFSAHTVQAVSYDAVAGGGSANVNSCGTLLTTGTYSVTTDFSATLPTGPCFVVTANDVIINSSGANHFTITATGGSTGYAIVATSSTANGGSAYGTTTVQNLTFTSFNGGGINASGNQGTGSTAGGAGGSVSIATSTMGTVVTTGGGGGNTGASGGGASGSITISNSTTGAATASGGGGNGGSGGGGNAGAMTISNSTTGAVTATGGYGGATAGGNAGTITISNSTTGAVTATGGGGAAAGGNAGTITISTSTVTTVAASGGSGNIGGTAGTINISSNSTTGAITANGGSGSSTGSSCGAGAAGGAVTVTSSTVTTVTLIGGTGGARSSGGAACNGGNAGTVILNTATSTGLIYSIPGAAGTASGSASAGSAGSGATSTIATSTTANITNGGTNGAIIITGANVVLSGNTYNATGTAGTLTVTFSTTLTATNTTLSALALTVNAPGPLTYSLPTFAGGTFPLIPAGTISTCGTLNFAGTYTLGQSISSVSGSCFTVLANGITIDGSSSYYTVTAAGGNTSYAVIATSSTAGNPGYGTTTINNITFTSFGGGGINSTGSAGSGSGVGGNGGAVIIATSTIGDIVTSGGLGGSSGSGGGVAGTVSITNSTINGGGTVTSSGGGANGGTSAGVGGLVTITNSTTTGAVTANGGAGSTGGGNTGGTINITTSTTTTVTATGGSGGSGNAGNGGVVSISSNSNTGAITVSGGAAGSLDGGVGGSATISNSTVTGTITASGDLGKNAGTITITNSTATTVTANGGTGSNSAVYTGGTGGTINITTSTTTTITANGGIGSSASSGAGGVGGTVNISSNSGVGITTASGGDGTSIGGGSTCAAGGVGGLITINSSTIATTTSAGGKGANKSSGGGSACNGGDARAISLSNSTATGLISNSGGLAGVGTGGVGQGSSGNGTTTVIATSTTSSVTSTGTNGTISITGANVNLSNNTYTASSTLSVAYSGTLTTTNTVLSALTDLVLNTSHYGSYAGGAFPLIAGTINSCGTIIFSGTYTLGGNITGVSGPCFTVLANNVTISGSASRYTVTAAGGNTSYAIIATSTTSDGGSAYSPITIQNINFTSFGGGGINATGNSSTGGSVGGTGGSVTVATSTMGAIVTSGGTGGTGLAGGNAGTITVTASTIATTTSAGGAGGNKTGSGTAGNGGNAGAISFANSTSTGLISDLAGTAGVCSGCTDGSIGLGSTVTITTSTTTNVTSTGASGTISVGSTNVDLSNNTYTAGSTLNLTYSTLITTNTTLSALAHLIVNTTDVGSYVGGAFPILPVGTISSCGTLYFAGTYTLGANPTSNCDVQIAGVTIAGAGNTLTGNVTANNYGVILSNIHINGAASTTGSNPGALTVNDATTIAGPIGVTGIINKTSGGLGSLGNTTIYSGGSVTANSVSFTGDVANNGTINSGNTVAGNTTNNSIINGDFTFNATSTNTGTVNGNAIFNASSTNYLGTSLGTVTGTARFNALPAAVGSVISFSGTTAFGGTGYVTGNIYDSTNSQINSWIFNNSSTNTGYTKGGAIFNNTSSNTVTGTIVGNAVFNNSSTNLGTISGNADVYSPVSRPLGGTASQKIYHGYPGLYFNDAAVGHGTSGKWDDINNWWTDTTFTTHASVVPTSGDDVVIYGKITNSTITAIANTITFQGTSTNAIDFYVSSSARDAALFNASSTNTGTIHGNATFSGDDTSTESGSVTGYITRQYSTDIFTVTKDFTHNGGVWIVQAINGAQVSLAGATYSLINNTFQALSNGVFTAWNALFGGSGVPNLVVTSPVSGTNIKWAPNVSWGTSTLCQYKVDGGSYTTAVCASNGSDIPRPNATSSHVFFFKSTDAHGDVAEKSVSFTYDNTQAVDTDCSTPLDESTRPYYYLTANVGNCIITASTTLRGDDNGGGHFYTVGNITGTSTNDVALQNVTATGAISAFNNITVSSSTLSGAIDVTGTLAGDTLSRMGANGTTTVESGGTIASGVFVGNVVNKSGGIITNNANSTTVVGNTTNSAGGVINGDFTFNGASTNAGTINGNLSFGTLTAVSGAIYFSGTTSFAGTGNVTGSIKDHSGNTVVRWVFNASSTNAGFTKGDASFNDTSSNAGAGTISGNAYFSDLASNAGTVTGTAKVYNATTPLAGSVNGATTYYSYPNAESFNNAAGDGSWSNPLNWFTDATFAIPLGRIPQAGERVVLFASATLSTNVTNNVFIAAGGITLDGGGVGGFGMHTLTGDVSGDGAYGDLHAFGFNLANIILVGTTTANGANAYSTYDGGNGGDINVATSSTGTLSANGGDPDHNGGSAGIITVTNSYAISGNTPILAKGGDSSGCGYGGSGGNVILIDTADYSILDNSKGVDSVGSCTRHGSQGQGGGQLVIGHYTPPTPKSNPTPSVPVSSSSHGSSIPFVFGNLNSPLTISVAPIKTLNLLKLPVFGGTGPNAFSFESLIKDFLFAPLSSIISKSLENAPQLSKYLASSGLSTQQDLLLLGDKPLQLTIPEKNVDIPDGLIMVSSKNVPVPLYITYNNNNFLTERVTVTAGSPLTVSLFPTIKGQVSASFNSNEYIFSKLGKTSLLSINLNAPIATSTYILKTNGSPLPLVIAVVSSQPNVPTIEKVKKQSVWSVLKFW